MSSTIKRSTIYNHIEEGEVGTRARAGVAWSLLQVVFRNAINLTATAVLARSLTADDYGLIGMVATLTALLTVFADMGLSWATVQRRELTDGQVTNLFWINVVAGSAMWGVCILAAPAVASFYGDHRLVVITKLLGATFFIGGFAVQPFALLRRKLRMRAIAKIEIFAALISALIAVAAASLGAGYWSLVAQALLTYLFRAILVIPVSQIKISLPKPSAGTRSMLVFGGLLAANSLLIYVARTADSILIGKYWGAQELGYYDRAYFLMLVPSFIATGVLTNLMVPSLAALQHNQIAFGNAYRRAVRLVAYTGCPMALGLALTAFESVRLLYGDSWSPVAPMLMWLSVAGISQPVYNTTGWLFTATGSAKIYLAMTLLNAFVLTSVFLFSIQFGGLGMAIAYGLTMGVALFLPSMWVAHKSAGMRLRDTLITLFPVFGALGFMGACVYTAGIILETQNVAWWLVYAIKIGVGILAYSGATFLLLRDMLREDLAPMLPAKVRRLFPPELKEGPRET